MFPSPLALILETPLYQLIAADDSESRWALIDFLFYAGTYDNYCPQCTREATFKATPPARPSELVRDRKGEANLRKIGGQPPAIYPPTGVHHVRAQCTRVAEHTQVFIYLVQQQVSKPEGGGIQIGTTIQKIGQHPSFADLHLAKAKRYAGVLSKQQLGEFSRAIGLASHDVGIGAYVYLRRIFEALVEEAHLVAQSDAGWDDAQYQRSRMSEKIALLRSHLPGFIVEHPHMYSLLSKGVHELTEQECLAHFETLRVATELILDERLQAKERAQKISEAKAALAKAAGGAA